MDGPEIPDMARALQRLREEGTNGMTRPYTSPYASTSITAPQPTASSYVSAPVSYEQPATYQPHASTLPPSPHVNFQPYIHDNATVWADVLAPQPTRNSQASTTSSALPKTRKTRKRRSKKPLVQLDEEMEDEPELSIVPVQYDPEMEFQPDLQLGTFRKRLPNSDAPQSPSQIHRPYNLAALEVAPNLENAAAAVFTKVSARLSCIYKQAYGNLLLSDDLAMLGFIKDVQPIPETPTLLIPISSITEQPILSAKGSNPMEIRVKVNKANGEKTTYRFIFKETGAEPEPSQLMRHQIMTAILNNQFNPQAAQVDLPEFEDNDLPAAPKSNKGEAPVRAEDEFGPDNDLPQVNDPDLLQTVSKSKKGKKSARKGKKQAPAVDEFGPDDDLPQLNDVDLLQPIPKSKKGKEPMRADDEFGPNADLPGVDDILSSAPNAQDQEPESANEFGADNDLPGVDEFLCSAPNTQSQGPAPVHGFGADGDLPDVVDAASSAPMSSKGKEPVQPENAASQGPVNVTVQSIAPTSKKGKEPVRPENAAISQSPASVNVQPSISKTAKAKKPRQVLTEGGDQRSENAERNPRSYPKAANPADPTKPYECSGCKKGWKQSWGLHYHLTKSNSACNPNKVKETEPPNIQDGGMVSAPQESRSEDVTFPATLSIETPRPQTLPIPSSTPAITPKKRGRPPKNRIPNFVPLPEDVPEDFPAEAEKPKRKLGRPRKQPADYAQAVQVDLPKECESQAKDTNETRTSSGRALRPTPKKRLAQEATAEPIESSDSEDSVIEFFQKHNTSGVERPRNASSAAEPKSSPSKKAYKALPFEFSVLREIASELAAPATESATPSTSTDSTTMSPSLASQRCEDILLSLINDNNGIFPGEKAIWVAFVGVWLKKFPGSTVLPESKLCSKTVDHLVETNKLCSTQFVWIDSKKRNVTRNILMLLGSKINSKAMGDLKEMIKQAYPEMYIPPQFAPAEPMLSKLNAVALRKLSLAEKDRLRLKEFTATESDSESDSRAQSPMQLDDESSDDDFKAGEFEEDEVLEDEIDEEMEAESEEQGDWQDDEPEQANSRKQNSKKRKRNYVPKNSKDGDRWNRQRDPKHNKAIAEGVRRNWAERKANNGGDDYFPNRKKRAWKKAPTEEEKAQRVEEAYLRLRSWVIPVAYMPNMVTGAWNQPIKPKKSGKRGGRKKDKPRLPEVITFMQPEDGDGAWSMRPYGHGVFPVHARPSKRADPADSSYLARNHRDHRPVIFPTKNRVHLPAMLPKASAPRPRREISRITGLPKRKYERRSPKERSDIGKRMSKGAGAVIVHQNRFPSFIPGDAKDTTDRTKPAVDEVSILAFFEPPKLSAGSPNNPGLESLPPKFGLLRSIYKGGSALVHEFQPDYNKVDFIDPSVITGGEDPDRGSWTVGVWQPVVASGYKLRWDDATALTMETLPIDKLYFADDSDYEEVPEQKRRGRKRKPQHTKIAPQDLTSGTRFEFTRIMTALPTDFTSILQNPQDATEELGVQVARPNRAAKHNRRIKGRRAVLSPQEEKRLIVTVIILRTLTGGLNATIDWVLVSQSFQDYTCNFLARYWKSIQHSKKEVIDSLSDDFEKLYMRAYKGNRVPRINYNDLPSYPWESLVKWVIDNKNIDTSMVKKQKKLRSPIGKSSVIEDVPRPPNTKSWRDQVLSDKTAHYKKLDLATVHPRTFVYEEVQREPTKDELRVVRSWTRAVALTPDGEFDRKFAEKKLLSLIEKTTIKSIVKDLQAQKVLLRASRTRRFFGCPFEVTSKFLEPLTKIDIFVEQFVEAAAAKTHLDMKFAQGDDSVPHSYFADVGSMMCVTSLQAQQMVVTGSFKWPSENKQLGVLDGGGYETRKIPRDLYTFEIVVKRTEKWVQDSDNEQLQTFLKATPPCGSAAGELPLWYGITGKINVDIWKRVLCSIGSFLHCRSATTVETILEHFGATFEEWELRLLLDWGTELCLFTSADGGWDVGTWWWLMLGRVCDDGRPVGKGK